MSDTEEIIRANYGRAGLVDRIDEALAKAGKDPRKPHYSDYFLFDQLHSIGIVGTRDHADRANLAPRSQVLDLGCGIGGASRYLVAERHCRVTGVDLTTEYIDVAKELTARCGLDGHIEYRVANALALPFPDEAFDHVWCHYVTMNILDKERLTKEIARVLKRGGRFSCVEVSQGPAGPPDYPVPWAKNAEASFLVSPEEMRGIVETSGLHVIEQTDITPSILAYAREAADRVAKGHPAPVAHGFVVADDFPVRVRNSSLGFSQRKLIDQFILAERR